MPKPVNAPPAPSRRIGVDLPESLLARLDTQAAYTGVARQHLIVSAVTGLVREFEQIDTEEGVACPDCGGDTEVDQFPDGKARVCVRCHWRWKL